MRIVDIQLSFPAILIALILIAVLGQGTGKVIAALVTVQWAYYARTVRSAALVEKRKEYIEAARCLALSPARIVFRHLLPNCLPPMIVVATVQVAAAIALEATLSFLGLGLPITEPSLGLLIANGYQYLLSGKYWISFFPGIALLCTIVSINLVADQLRDVLNPRLQRWHDAMTPLLEVDGLRTHFFTRAGVVKAVDDVSFTVARGRGAGARRRVGVGQVDDRLLDHGPRRSAGPHRRRRRSGFDGARPAQRCRRRTLRQLRGNRIAMIFQDPMMTLNPVLCDRRADDRDDPRARECSRAKRRASARARALVKVGIPSPDERLAGVPAPVLRRHAPARRDRDRAAQQSGPHHRRRADDRARRDDPGADPVRDAEAHARDRRGDDLDHARPVGHRRASPTASA